MDVLTRWRTQHATFLFIVMSVILCTETSSSAVQLNSNNINEILGSHELVFVNFYADWCRFSQMLSPVFDEASNKVKEFFPEDGKVALAKVDCDKEGGIAAQYHVSKYPTLKVFRFGTLVKREYRGQRSAEALANYVRDAVKDNVKRVQNLDDLDNLDRKKRHIIGYFDAEDGPDFKTFQKIASMLRDDCEFHAAIGAVSEKERTGGNRIVFRPPNDPDASDIPYTGDLTAYNMFQAWANDKCVPLVREITFENAEELTEEGLPFMILFHHPDDTETPEKFRTIVARELLTEKSSVNFLTADGQKFSHPLYHLGKSTSDLPIIAIDSFRHMYLWKHNPKEHMEDGTQLKQFIADLHSGKLHREFHHGPDATTAKEEAPKPVDSGDKTHIPHDSEEKKVAPPGTTPPESTFRKLAPSRTRYTLLRDEL